MAKRDLYEVQGDTLTRKRKHCPKCGEGVFLAEHKDRTSCGACGYTEFKKPKVDAKPKKDGEPKQEDGPKQKPAQKPKEEAPEEGPKARELAEDEPEPPKEE